MTASLFTVDLAKLVLNWQLFQGLCSADGGVAECASVVKADAYGLGAERVCIALYEAGCRTFFVAHGCEGALVRGALVEMRVGVSEAKNNDDAVDVRIIVFHGCRPGEEALFHKNRLTPVLNSIEDARRWAALEFSKNSAGAVLHVDTGMNRLGLNAEDFQNLCSSDELLDDLDIRLIMTHLVASDDPSSELNALQKQRFDQLMQLRPEKLASVPLSMANSAGVLQGTDYHYDVVRVGIGLYGGNPCPLFKNPLSPVVSLEAEIIQLKQIKAGESVSYGATYRAKNPMDIATLSLGYADGLLRAQGIVARVAINGAFAPIVGRVTMDLIMVDVTGIDACVGDMVEIMGTHIRVDELAARSDTIAYEVLTGLGRQFPSERMLKRYVGS